MTTLNEGLVYFIKYSDGFTKECLVIYYQGDTRKYGMPKRLFRGYACEEYV